MHHQKERKHVYEVAINHKQSKQKDNNFKLFRLVENFSNKKSTFTLKLYHFPASGENSGMQKQKGYWKTFNFSFSFSLERENYAHIVQIAFSLMSLPFSLL